MKIDVNIGPFLFISIAFVMLMGLLFLVSHPVFFGVLFVPFIAYLVVWHAPERGKA